jgi:hypothetical protein
MWETCGSLVFLVPFDGLLLVYCVPKVACVAARTVFLSLENPNVRELTRS